MSVWVLVICAGVRREGTVLEVVSASGSSSELSVSAAGSSSDGPAGARPLPTPEQLDTDSASGSICEFGLQKRMWGSAIYGGYQDQTPEEFRKGQHEHLRRKGYWCVKKSLGCPGTMSKARSQVTGSITSTVFRGVNVYADIKHPHWADPCYRKGKSSMFGSKSMCCTDEEHYTTLLTGSRAKLEMIKSQLTVAEAGRGFTVPADGLKMPMVPSEGWMLDQETGRGVMPGKPGVTIAGYQTPAGVVASGGPPVVYPSGDKKGQVLTPVRGYYQGGILEDSLMGGDPHWALVDGDGAQADPFAALATWVQIEVPGGRYEPLGSSWDMVLDKAEAAAAAENRLNGAGELELQIRVRFDQPSSSKLLRSWFG